MPELVRTLSLPGTETRSLGCPAPSLVTKPTMFSLPGYESTRMKHSARTSGPSAENTTDVLMALPISSRPTRGPKTTWVESRRVLRVQNRCIYCCAKFLDDVRSDMCVCVCVCVCASARARNIRSQRMHRMRQRDSCKQISFQQLPKI